MASQPAGTVTALGRRAAEVRRFFRTRFSRSPRDATPTLDLSDPELWTGSYYGLLVGWRQHDFDALDRAYVAALSHRTMNGPVAAEARNPARSTRLVQPRPPGADEIFEAFGGVDLPISLPGGWLAPCKMWAVAYESGDQWLDLGIPLSGLERCYPGAGALGLEGFHEKWRRPVDALLVEVARDVFGDAEFDLALVGYTEGLYTLLEDFAEVGVPNPRFEGYLVPKTGELVWHPPTHYDTYP